VAIDEEWRPLLPIREKCKPKPIVVWGTGTPASNKVKVNNPNIVLSHSFIIFGVAENGSLIALRNFPLNGHGTVYRNTVRCPNLVIQKKLCRNKLIDT
jgi:hypothetical protein